MENNKITRMVCENCMKEKQKQYHNSELYIFRIDDFIKLKIEDCYGVEYMWFKITKIEEDLFIGVLSSEPCLIKCLKFGEMKRFRKSEVVDYMEKEKQEYYENKFRGLGNG